MTKSTEKSPFPTVISASESHLGFMKHGSLKNIRKRHMNLLLVFALFGLFQSKIGKYFKIVDPKTGELNGFPFRKYLELSDGSVMLWDNRMHLMKRMNQVRIPPTFVKLDSRGEVFWKKQISCMDQKVTDLKFLELVESRDGKFIYGISVVKFERLGIMVSTRERSLHLAHVTKFQASSLRIVWRKHLHTIYGKFKYSQLPGMGEREDGSLLLSLPLLIATQWLCERDKEQKDETCTWSQEYGQGFLLFKIMTDTAELVWKKHYRLPIHELYELDYHVEEFEYNYREDSGFTKRSRLPIPELDYHVEEFDFSRGDLGVITHFKEKNSYLSKFLIDGVDGSVSQVWNPFNHEAVETQPRPEFRDVLTVDNIIWSIYLVDLRNGDHDAFLVILDENRSAVCKKAIGFDPAKSDLRIFKDKEAHGVVVIGLSQYEEDNGSTKYFSFDPNSGKLKWVNLHVENDLKDAENYFDVVKPKKEGGKGYYALSDTFQFMPPEHPPRRNSSIRYSSRRVYIPNRTEFIELDENGLNEDCGRTVSVDPSKYDFVLQECECPVGWYNNTDESASPANLIFEDDDLQFSGEWKDSEDCSDFVVKDTNDVIVSDICPQSEV